MNVYTPILIAVVAFGLAAPDPTMGQAWETDDNGFFIEPAPSTTRTRRAQRRRSYRVQPQQVVVGQPVCRVMPTPPPLNEAESAESETAHRSFSYVPTAMAKGANVEVVEKESQLMRGRDVLGRVEVGQMLTVLDVRGPWVGVIATIDGKQHNGWIRHANLKAAKATEIASTEIAPAVPAALQAYRSFSYEPAAIESTSVQPMIIASGTAAVRSTRGAVRSRRRPTYLRPGAKARGDFGHGGR